MVTYTWKIINTLFFIVFIILIIVAYIFFAIRTYDNVLHHNSSVKGEIITQYFIDSNSPGTERFRNYGYNILSSNDTLKAISSVDKKYDVNDVVEGYLVGRKSIKITKVNNIKVASRYSFIDYLSLFITLIIPILIFILTKKQIK